MTTSALHQTRPSGPVVGQPLLTIDEIEPWIHEVDPVLDALRHLDAPPSAGQRRWMTDQVSTGTQALVLLECEWFEAEGTERACGELQWLHTRVTALVERSRALLSRRVAA